MRKYIAMSLVTVMALSLVACGGEEKAQEGKIKLGTYKGIEIYESDLDVEEKLQSTIDAALTAHATDEKKEEGKVKETDVVNIDYEGTIDGYAFDKGSDTGYDLDIDNNTFIEGFASGLIGKKVGKTVKLNLKFPDDYEGTTKDKDGNPLELAGKDVQFKVKINYRTVKVNPEYNDAFIAEHYSAIGKTVEEYEAYITKQLQISNVMSFVWEDFEESCTVETYPTKEVESYQAYVSSNNEAQINSSLSVELETYLEVCSMTMDDWNAKNLETAQHKIKYDMIIKKIQEEAKLDVVTAESKSFNKLAEKFALTNGIDLATLQMYYGVDSIVSILNDSKVQEYIFDNATIVKGDRPEEKTEKETEEETK